MLPAWDFNIWFLSIGAELFMLGLLTGFSVLATALMSRIWGEASCNTATMHMCRTSKEPPIRKAA
jgi:hypothetical protein